jgi:hypothetical protein
MSMVPVTRVHTLRRSMLAGWMLLGQAQKARLELAVRGSVLRFHGRWGGRWFAIVSSGVSVRLCASGLID